MRPNKGAELDASTTVNGGITRPWYSGQTVLLEWRMRNRLVPRCRIFYLIWAYL